MKVLTSLDIGTGKVTVLVGEIDSYGDIHIIGVGEAPSKGIDRGYITRLDLAVQTILTALREAQEMSSTRIDTVFINVSGPNVKSQNEKDTVSVSPQPTEIDQTHIDRLIERAITRAKEEGYEVISAVPRRFLLDDQEGVIDPVGLLGSRLSAEVHVVKVGSSMIRNLEKAIASSGLKIGHKFLSSMASSEAVLTTEEKEEGVLLMDMGAGLTDFVLYADGSPVITGSVPMGGINITKDIAHFMKIASDQAERIKIEYGFAIADLVNETERVKIKPRGEDKETMVSKKQLSEVIQIRLEEIMDKVMGLINSHGVNLDSANAGIVITGGCAKLSGIREFLERYFDLPVRVGYPTGVIGLKEKVQDPAYSTSVGLLKLAYQEQFMGTGTFTQNAQDRNASTRGIDISSFLAKIKAFFKDVM
ncbi:cell division protein FtsA [Hydrogenobacter thermophilus TK-6]|uniref:Cell division protein FtsA n=1 Tax=Hydrogenobacter thermophilus (strain DSM 6534 / IAM 12695 / TK-6) TaxID=608538 RepID=D3DK94_HYDTT|nr:cell division protein FtsA [Hydrogenobacter thermophilus]ADO46165.1 cell division protein FtsA [Hydrogenobacter thermophilus TK-6]BAI70246.1 cell division protein [Hydrogenobacter thermophilus TK-6]GBC88340.1 Cell division protein FtsA [bacterium HR13]